MSFTLFKNGIYTSSDTFTGDAATAINNNFIAVANALDTLATVQTNLSGYLPLTGGTLSGNLGLSGASGAIVFNDGPTIALSGSDITVNTNLNVGTNLFKLIADCTIGTDGESGIQITDFNGNTLVWNTHHGLGLQLTGDSCGIKFPDGSFQSTAASSTVPTIANLSVSGTLGQLGMYGTNLYYYTGTIWRRASSQFIGI